MNPIERIVHTQSARHQRRRFGPEVLAEVTRLEREEMGSSDEIRAAQWARLTALLDHAYRCVPFYRRRFGAAGLEPGDVRDWDDFARLPVLTRDAVQADPDGMLAEEPDSSRLVRRSTSGTSGRALTLYFDRPVKRYRKALDLLAQRRVGYRFGDRHAYLWGRRSRRDGGVGRAVRQRLRRERRIDVESLTEETLLAEARALAQWRPRFLFGYAVPLVELARTVRSAGVDALRPEGILTTAETLGPAERRLLEDVFATGSSGCPVFDTYFTREVGLVAQECAEHRGFHVTADSNVVEVIDLGGPDGPAAPGAVVITNLRNFAMPLIRYRPGDLASLSDEPCPCGRGAPRLERLDGREIDLIRTPAGRILHASFFHRLFDDVPGVGRWQVVQTSPESVTIRIVRTAGYGPAGSEKLVDAIRREDDAFRVAFEWPEAIGSAGGGKFRCTVGLHRAGKDGP